jgi:hypothetical protein
MNLPSQTTIRMRISTINESANAVDPALISLHSKRLCLMSYAEFLLFLRDCIVEFFGFDNVPVGVYLAVSYGKSISN